MKDLDDVLTKREKIYDPRVGDEERNALAMRYLEADRPAEALEFLERTGDRDGLLRVRAWAVEHGEAFILTQTERFLRDQAPPAEWRAAAERAARDARWHHAQTAYERAGDEAEAARAAENVPEPPPIGPPRRKQLKEERERQS